MRILYPWGVISGHFILQLAYLTPYNRMLCDQENQDGSIPFSTGLSLKLLSNSWFGREFWPLFDILWSVQLVSEPLILVK